MAKKNNNRFELNKGGGRKFDLDKGTGKHRFDLSKDDELIDEENVSADAPEQMAPVAPVNPPQPEEPASIKQPDLSKEATDRAIEYGPEEPKKKGFAWLWALIGIAIVLAFLGMLFLNRGEKEEDKQIGDVEAVISSADDSASVDSTPVIGSDENAAPQENASEETPVNNSGNATSNDETQAAASTESTPAAKIPSTPTAANTPAPASDVNGEVEAEALKVIHGDYGDGDVRKDRLGSRYNEIQSRVNQLKRSGRF